MPGEEPAWQGSYQIGDTTLALTPAELSELGRRVWDLITSYEGRQPGEGKRDVTVFYAGYPRP